MSGKRGQGVAAEPAGVFNFNAVGFENAGDVAGGKACHEGMGERPGLRDDVAYVADFDADFFEGFAGGGGFEGFARFDKTGDEAVYAGGEFFVVGKQDFSFVVGYERDDCRGDAGVFYASAGGAKAGQFIGMIGVLGSAASAKQGFLPPLGDVESLQ